MEWNLFLGVFTLLGTDDTGGPSLVHLFVTLINNVSED